MPSIERLQEKGKDQEKLVPGPYGTSHAADPTLQGPNAELLRATVPLQHEFCSAKVIPFLGQRFRIILQDKNGPCSLIAICNYLILKRKITLPNWTRVSQAYLLELVYRNVFSNMKNEEYHAVFAAVSQTTSGLDIDINCSSVDGFEDTPQYQIFRILDIPLYHRWVLDLDLEEEAAIYDAIDERSYNQLNLDQFKYMAAKTADKPTEVLEVDGSSSGTTDNDEARKNMDHKYDLINKFLEDSRGQITDYGLHALNKTTKDGKIFIFFRNEHFSIIYKHNGTFFNLLTDAGYQNSRKTWQIFDNLLGDGLLVDILTPLDQMLNVSAADYHKKHSQHDKQSQQHCLSLPFESNPDKWRSKESLKHDSSSNNMLSSSSSGSQLEARRLSPGLIKAQFASFFTGTSDEKLESKFLDFLRGYKENGVLYYGTTVNAMKDL